MSKERNVSSPNDDLITSAGVRLGDVPDFVRGDVEWIDGIHGSAADGLPSQTYMPTPEILNTLEGTYL